MGTSMNKLLIGSVALLLFIVGCPNGPTPPTDTAYCQAAEQNLQALCNRDQVANKHCCEVVKPTLKGKSFTQFCQETQGNLIHIFPQCLSKITSCSQIDTCK